MLQRPRLRRALRALPIIVAITFVLFGYLFFASAGRFDFDRMHRSELSMYASLADGFAHGRLSMWWPVDPRIAALANPYEIKSRGDIFYPWDASYLNNHYYLYFSPLPVFLAYMPMHFLRGAYPSDALVAALFSFWAFLATVEFTRRAIAKPEGRSSIPFAIWILLIGFGNVVPFTLDSIHAYEIAILCGAAMTAMWALALLVYLQSPAAGNAAWTGFWLALAIAARPNLGVLLFVTAAALFFSMKQQRQRIVRTSIAFLVPLAIAGVAMIAYNVARFSDPFEFGHRYQLTTVSMAGRHVCGIHNLAELMRLGNNVLQYVFVPFTVRSRFPFLDLVPASLDPLVSWPTPGNITEQIVGMGALIPLVLLGTALAFLRNNADPEHRAAVWVIAGGWLVLFGVSSCWWTVARYSLDFSMLIAGASIVFIDGILAKLPIGARIAIVALALYSIAAGVLLGFDGPGGAFAHGNPALFSRIANSLK